MLGAYSLGRASTSIGASEAEPASASSFSVSISENVDLEIIGEIIDRAPRSAVTFPQVYRAYTEVLEDHGLSPSSDTAYYQFLLKLGVIRAPTWGERWDHWRDQTQADGIGRVRARVPFLNDASSDLDEGYDDHRDVQLDLSADEHHLHARHRRQLSALNGYHSRGDDEEEEETTVNSDEDRAHDQGQHEHSLIGYTPSASVEISDLDLPVRTSTPVNGRRGSSPAPYIVSDLGRSLDALALTPKAQPWSRALSRDKAGYDVDLDVDGYIVNRGQLDSGDEEEDEGKGSVQADVSMDKDLLAELERRAETFYSLGLLGRCLSTWSRGASWLQRTTVQIDEVRTSLLLRQTLSSWRRTLDRHLDLPSTADKHHAMSVQRLALGMWAERARVQRLAKLEVAWAGKVEERAVRKTWKKWRREVVRIRTKRWEQDLAQREAVAVERHTERILGGAFDAWRDATLSRAADELYAQKALHSHFFAWLKAAQQQQLLRGKLAVWDARQSTTQLGETFDTWRSLATVLPIERELAVTQDNRAIVKTWAIWRDTSIRRKKARDFDDARVLRMAMKRWKKSARKLRVMEHEASVILINKDARLTRITLDQWTRAERVKLMVRVHDQRVLSRCLSVWRGKLAAVGILNDKAIAMGKSSAKRVVYTSFSRWRDRIGREQNAALQADLVAESRLAATCFDTWRQGAERNRSNVVTANKARAFFALRTAFGCWQKANAKRKQAAFAEERRLAQLREYFQTWCEATTQSLSDKAVVAAFQRKQGKRILTKFLSKWTERVVDIKSRELDVVEHRDGMLIRDAMDRWREASHRQNDRIGLMNSFIDLQQEETQKRLFLHWLDRARTSRDHQARLSDALQTRDARLVSSVFSTWVDSTRERSLAPIEEEVAQRSEDALLFTVFDRWKDRSTRLAAVSYDIRRVRGSVWPRWRKALERAQENKAVARMEEERVLRNVLGKWRERTRTKVGARVRRGRVRPTSSLGGGGGIEPGRRGLNGPPSSSPIDNHRRVTAPLPCSPSIRRPFSSRDLTELRDHSSPRSTEEADASVKRQVGRGGGGRGASSVVSEPAYSRLRSELRTRAGTEEPVVATGEEEKESQGGRRETKLVGALRRGLV